MEASSPRIDIFLPNAEDCTVLSTRHRGWTAPQQVGYACADLPWLMSSVFLPLEKMIVEGVHHTNQLHRRKPFFYRYNLKSETPIGDKNDGPPIKRAL